jgi:outer membrane biosynthesis protein TonB
MKVGLTTSTALHMALIGFGLFAMSAPPPHQSAAVESFPIDIVPLEEFSQSARGEREAPLREQPAPEPTTETSEVENAQNIGDSAIDHATPPTPEPRPRPVETASAPPPAEEPAPQPPTPEPAPAREAPPPEPEPVAEAAPEPEPAPAEPVRPEFAQLPDRMQAPPARPERPRPQTAQTPERRQTEQPSREQTASTNRDDQQFNEDQIAALLNRDRPSGGGAQRSTQEAALGGRQTTGATLAQSEIDSLRSQVSRCWNPPVGAAEAENLVVSIRIRLSRSGELEGNPEVVAGGGASMAERAAADAARRAVLRCQPYSAPADKYEAWADVQFNFDPRDMF